MGYYVYHAMEHGTPPHFLRNLSGTITRGLLLAIIFPLIPAVLFGISLSSSLALISSTLVIEYGAAALGIGLGLPPVYILYVLVCVASGVTLTVFDVFDRAREYSPRVSRFLEKSEEQAHRSTILAKYGIFGLIPCVLTLGFYVCPAVSMVMGWRRDLSILLIMGGYISISIVTLLATMGIFRLVF
ncbi:MAG: hypothetical protein WC294_04645 [Methanoregula sp.]|jgi:hypothetical protein